MTTSSNDPAVADVLRDLADLVPYLAERAGETERNRDVLPEVIKELESTGFYRLARPRRFGGLEAPFGDLMRAVALIARGCPSTGWVASIQTDANWVFATFADSFQDEVFAAEHLRAAVSFTPSGVGQRTAGGAVVTGTWQWSTGSSSAQWIGVTAMMADADGVPEPVLAVLPRSAVRTVDDWYASGMAGTGSNSVVVQDAFVPADRLYPLARWMSGPYSSDREAANPYFQKPVITTFVGLSAAVPLGIAEGAYEAFLHRLPGRMITFTDYLDQRAAPVTHHQLAQARMALETARMHAGATAGLLTDMSLDTGMETRFQSRAHAAYGVEAARDCVDQLFRASGASTILSSVPMQRYQRDIQAMAQHAFLYAPSTMETYGRTLLGLEPNTRFV